MKSPALPPDEVSRLHELRDFQLLDTSPESSLDDLTALAAQICDAPIALISLVDGHRQWFKSCLGLDLAETSRDLSFCGHAILQPDLFLIPDAAQDERFAGNPLVLGDPHIRFYAGAPLVSPVGHALGTLCVMDRVPRQLTGPQQQALVTLARQVMQHFVHRRQNRRLLESESLLGILTEHIRAGLFILDRERRYLYVSQAYAEIVRLPLAAILGRSPEDLMPDIYQASIRPHLDRAYAGERVHFESTRPGPEGQHHYSVTYEPRTEAGQVTCVVGVILDITDRKAAETDSERQRAELQLILDTVPALVFYKDRESRFLRVNRQLARLARVSPEDFIGKSDAEMGSPEGAKYRQDDLQVMTSGEPLRQLEERIHTADGIRWLLTDKLPHRDEQGRITGIVGFSVDITARKLAQEAMLRTQADLQLALDAARLGRWDWNIVTNEVNWSPECLAHYGLPPETPMDYARFLSLIHPEDRAQVEASLQEAVQNSSSYESEKRVIWPDGSVHWTASRGQVYRNQTGDPVRLTGVTFDITERKLAELAVQKSESSLQEAQRLAKLGKWEWHSRRDVHVWSPEVFEMYGRDPRLGPAKVPEVAQYFTPQSWARLSAAVNVALADGTAYECDAEVVRPDGRHRWITARGETMRDDLGQIFGLRGTVQDITARKQSEAALHEALERFETLAKATNDAVWDWDLLTDEVWWNEGFQTLFGHRPEETERTVATWVAFLHPEERDRVVGEIQTAIDRGDRTWTGEYRFRRKDGTYAHVLDRGYILHDEQGKSVRMIGAMQDITARKQSEIQLRESEERFRQLAENINEVFWISDPEKRQVFYVSPAYEKIWGRTCDSLYQDPRTWFESVHPEDRQRVLDAALNKQVTGEYDEVYRISRPDGSRRWIHDRAFPIRDADGHVHRIVGTAEDISARRQLEEQFRQAQKMEAIGQLAGGVAHDFNNILAAIMMQTDLSASEKDLAGEVPEGLREIRALAERAANLTRQLLLFSRKQVMHTRDLDLNEAVTGIFKMLQRIIGEHFSVQYDLHSASLIVRADPGMLDQVLLNLVVNARDAMPKGGPIIIKTSETQFSPEEAALIPDAAPGRYCCLCVQDSGCGIPPENLNRIFEPFFTTKGQGKGTGLGLATVFGIVKQHGGFVRVESQVGQGTTFQILLPAAIVAAAPPESKPGKATPRGGTETILLVEDEHSVRMVTRILLERAGYKVLEAVNGVQALQVWEQHHEPIHLLFTDIVMPGGMDGRELAASLEARNPRLKVILTSGYSAEMAGREIALKESQTFLQKPAASRLVLQTVRHALDH